MNEVDIDQWKEFLDARVSGQRGRKLATSYIRYIEKQTERGFPPIFEFAHLVDLAGVDYEILAQMTRAPHQFYRRFTIPKRSGGIRVIDTPRPILLKLQRWVLDEILMNLSPSENAHGFVPNRSIITNARVHVGHKELLKLDIEDFFGSIKSNAVREVFESAGFPNNVCWALTRLVTKNSCLPQGAPSSPTLSNLTCLKLDVYLQKAAEENNLVYTRYADDMCFSGDAIPDEMKGMVSSILSKFDLRLNDKKTTLSRDGQRKIITGISISSGELKLPRSYLRELRKQIHYVVNHGILAHNVATENNDPLLLDRLLGMVAFWLQVSPDSQAAQDANTKLREYIRDFDNAPT